MLDQSAWTRISSSGPRPECTTLFETSSSPISRASSNRPRGRPRVLERPPCLPHRLGTGGDAKVDPGSRSRGQALVLAVGHTGSFHRLTHLDRLSGLPTRSVRDPLGFPERERREPLGPPDPGRLAAAAARIAGLIHRTPVLTCRTIDAAAAARPARASTCRRSARTNPGARPTRFAGCWSAAPTPGVVAASSGNHGQAVAWAAREGGVPATIVVPERIAAPKRAAIEGYGARVVVAGRGTRIDSRRRRAGRERGPGGHPAVRPPVTIGGQGTWVLEALEDGAGRARDHGRSDRGRGPGLGDDLAVEGAGRRGSTPSTGWSRRARTTPAGRSMPARG